MCRLVCVHVRTQSNASTILCRLLYYVHYTIDNTPQLMWHYCIPTFNSRSLCTPHTFYSLQTTSKKVQTVIEEWEVHS